MDGSHEYGGFVVSKGSCLDNMPSQTNYSRDGVTGTLKMSTDAVGVEASLQALARQVERDAPIRVDSTTQLVGATANAKTIRYILHAAIPGSRDEIMRSITAKMVAFMRGNYCATPAQFKILDDGAVILYEFRSEDGREFYATIPVSRQSCDPN